MHVLVTGSSGFIGGHVLQLLTDAGHEVTGFDISSPGPIAATVSADAQFTTVDISNPDSVEKTVGSVKPDCIIHLASLLVPASRANPRHAFEVNVGGTLNILKSAQNHDVDRVVAGSSVNVYGSGPPDTEYLTETMIRQPNSTYALTKYAIEWLGSRSDVEFAALESVHGFGPDRLRGNSYDAALVKAAVSGIPIQVPRTGIRDEYLYVRDSAKAFVTAATADTLSYDRYLVGTDQRATLAEIAQLTTEIVPEAEIELTEHTTDSEWVGDRNSHPPTDTTRIQSDIGWKPQYTLPEMVDAYVEWLINNPDSWTFSADDIPWH